MIKQLMIPAAAFAITATGPSAFTGDMLEAIDVDLTAEQITTLEEVHELRQDGADRDEIRSLLEDAGIDQDTMQEIHDSVHEYRDSLHEAIHQAIEDEDYDAYQEAVADTPQADLIDSEAEFQQLVEAHQLRQEGDREEAGKIMSELGFKKPDKPDMRGSKHGPDPLGNKGGFGQRHNEE